MLGKTLGHYRILEEIAAGGMGRVYRARDRQLDRDVALKVLLPHTLSDEAARKRIRKEALSLSKLNHPNIATVHDFGTQDGVDYLVMEYVKGTTLATRLKAGALTEKEAVRLAVQIALALEEAHANGVIHRDLKPSNLIVTPKGILKVLDFGLAVGLKRDLQDETWSVADPDLLAGTVPYMSPEQLRGEHVDSRSDVWACGAVLYEMVTGKRPFQQTQYTLLIEGILHREPRPLAEVNPRVSPGLDNIVRKSLEKEPTRRYQSARELLVALEQLQASSPSFISVGRKPRPMSARKKLVAAVVTVSLLVAVGWFGWVSRHPQSSQHPLVLVGEFENRTGNPVFDQTISELVTTSLEQSRFLGVYPKSRIQDVLQRMQKAPKTAVDENVGSEICEREGLQALVLGSMNHFGDSFVVMARAVSPKGRTLFSGRSEPVQANQILKELDAMVQKLRTALGESLASVQESALPLAQVTSSSLEAVRYFTLGRQRLYEGDRKGAISLLQKAIELDPQFAMAHNYLGVAYQNLGQFDLAEEHMQTAATLSGRVAEVERRKILGDYKLLIGNFDEACGEFQALAQLQPQDPAPHHGLGVCYANKMDWDAAVAEIRKALAILPGSASSRYNLSRSYLGKGDLASALAGAQDVLKDNPASYVSLRTAGRVHEFRGQFAEARRMFNAMVKTGDHGEIEGESALADLAMATGQYHSVKQHLTAGMDAAEGLGDKIGSAKQRVVLAEFELATGSRGPAVQLLSHTEYYPSDPVEVFLLGRAFAHGQQLEQAHKFLKAMADLSVKKPFPRIKSLQSLLQAEIAMAQGKSGAGVEAAERGVHFENTVTALDTLARAYEASGQGREAIHVYEEMLAKAPEIDNDDATAFHRVVEVDYRLGKLYLREKQADLARNHLESFLKAWSEADAGLEMRKAAEKLLREASQPSLPSRGKPTPAR